MSPPWMNAAKSCASTISPACAGLFCEALGPALAVVPATTGVMMLPKLALVTRA